MKFWKQAFTVLQSESNGNCYIGEVVRPLSFRANDTPEQKGLRSEFHPMATERKPEFFKGAQLKVAIIGCGYVGLPLALRFAEAGHKVTGFDTDPEESGNAECGKVVHRAYPANKNSAVREQPPFRGDHGLLQAGRSGRDPDLRADTAERIPRAGSQLRGRHGEVHPAAPAKRTIGGAGIDDLSRNDGRAGAAHPAEKRIALPDRIGPGERKCSRRFFPGIFAGARRPGQQTISGWRKFPKSWAE